jgi:hypothetical protein
MLFYVRQYLAIFLHVTLEVTLDVKTAAQQLLAAWR